MARRRRLPLVVGVAAVSVGVVAVIAATSVHGGGRPRTPQAVTDAYYRHLAKGDAAAAYDLLCAQQQQRGTADFTARVRADQSTGTAIAAWDREGPALVQGDEAVVAGRVRLANGIETPLHVLLLRRGDTWGVCTTDLGGVLPAPGTSGGTAA